MRSGMGPITASFGSMTAVAVAYGHRFGGQPGVLIALVEVDRAVITFRLGAEEAERIGLVNRVVPKDQLGAPARGLELDADSGPYGNKEGAEDTIDPHDSAASLRAGGRLGGYELNYSSPKALHIWRSGGGYSDVTTSVELFDTPSDAAVYLDTQARDFARFEGKTIGHGVRLKSADVVRITDIGESAWTIRGTVRFGKIVSRGTVVAFRRGRIVGSVSIGRGDTRDIVGPTRIIARASSAGMSSWPT